MSDRIELTAAELDGLAKRLVGERFAAIDVDDVFEWEHMPLLHQDQAEQLSEYIAKRLAESTAARRQLLDIHDRSRGIDTAALKEGLR